MLEILRTALWSPWVSPGWVCHRAARLGAAQLTDPPELDLPFISFALLFTSDGDWGVTCEAPDVAVGRREIASPQPAVTGVVGRASRSMPVRGCLNSEWFRPPSRVRVAVRTTDFL